MSVQDTVWQGTELTKAFLEGVRGAIPLANEQIDIMLRLVRAAKSQVNTILDLGCGDGILGQALLESISKSNGRFRRFLRTHARCRPSTPSQYTIMQFLCKPTTAKRGWQEAINNSTIQQLTINNSFDVIVSGYSIHHQPDDAQKGGVRRASQICCCPVAFS